MENNQNKQDQNNNNNNDPIKKDFTNESKNENNQIGQQSDQPGQQPPKPPQASKSPSPQPPKPPQTSSTPGAGPSTNMGASQPPQSNFSPEGLSDQPEGGTSSVGMGQDNNGAGEPFVPPQAESNIPSSSEQEDLKPKKSGFKLFIIFLVIAIIIVGAALAYFMIFADDNNETDIDPVPVTEEEEESEEETEEEIVEEEPEEEPREYISLFQSSDNLVSSNMDFVDRFSVLQAFESAVDNEAEDSYFAEFELRHEGDLVEFEDISSVFFSDVFGEEENSFFERDFSLFAYYVSEEAIWPGIVMKLSPIEQEEPATEGEEPEEGAEEEVDSEESLEDRREMINSAIEQNPSALTGLFYVDPGEASGDWQDGSAANTTTRYLVFEEDDAALNYGWVDDETLMITTSYNAFQGALEMF